MSEMGVARATAERIMEKVPVVFFEDLRRVYVKRSDVLSYIDTCTSQGEWRFVKTRPQNREK
jgi:hypothetical protein